MKNLWIRIQALILALAMTLSLSACKKEEEKEQVTNNLPAIASLLNSDEIADMTVLDEELDNNNYSILYLNDEKMSITDAFDRVMKFIDIIKIMPNLSEYKMDEDKSPLQKDEIEELLGYSLDEINGLINAAKYSGTEFGSVEKAQKARRELYGINWYIKGWINKNGYAACAQFLATLLRCAVADEFNVGIDSVSFEVTPYMPPEDGEKEQHTSVLIIKVTINGKTKEFRLDGKTGNPLYDTALAYAEANYYKQYTLGNTSVPLTEEDYGRMTGYYEVAETMLASGVNLSNGELVAQNSTEYVKGMLANR